MNVANVTVSHMTISDAASQALDRLQLNLLTEMARGKGRERQGQGERSGGAKEERDKARGERGRVKEGGARQGSEEERARGGPALLGVTWRRLAWRPPGPVGDLLGHTPGQG